MDPLDIRYTPSQLILITTKMCNKSDHLTPQKGPPGFRTNVAKHRNEQISKKLRKRYIKLTSSVFDVAGLPADDTYVNGTHTTDPSGQINLLGNNQLSNNTKITQK
jgi:hypothetical protein